MSEKATYTHGHHTSVTTSHARRTIHDSAAFLLPYIKPHHHILDLGCGPGSITVGLASLVPQGRVIGVDNVESVLDQARQLQREIQSHSPSSTSTSTSAAAVAAEEGVNAATAENPPIPLPLSNLTFQHHDGNNLPFPDDTFDIVYAHQVLQHVSDPVSILKEMKRVCKKSSPPSTTAGGESPSQEGGGGGGGGGGIIAARDADYSTFAFPPGPLNSHLETTWKTLYRRVAKQNGGEPDAGRWLVRWAREAGLGRTPFPSSSTNNSTSPPIQAPADAGESSVPRVQFSWNCWLYQGVDARNFAMSWKDRAVLSGFATTAVEQKVATREELQEISRAWEEFAEGREEDKFIVIPNGEILCFT